ncbi:hypothetical protein AGR7A_pAt20012 [Agrobacterium deltaense NCPPB 1641]|uniref:Uncharacterized protein n=1 Tax=Agrobacterium deltaense NCPPB 1641 TaxID=1183425 RepID=A0A1S7U7U2_9HYPH|nr:hypothetical protein AGR7A_pAt20012 [Agrobacterium deltaense NCPPB 1641]
MMLPFDVISTAPKTSLIAKIPCPPEDVMEDAFPSVMAIPPMVSTLMASPEADKPNPGCVTTVTGAEEKITADGSLPVAAPEQLQVPGPAGSQLPASDGEDQRSTDVTAAAEMTDKLSNDSTKRASQGAMPPTILLHFPTRPPRMSMLFARFVSELSKKDPPPLDGRFLKNAPGAVIHGPHLPSR